MSILFEHGDLLLRKETGYETLTDAFLVVDKDRITYIGKDKPKGNFDQMKNMKGKLLMPGLTNCHTHVPMTLLRGIGSGLPLHEWLFDSVFPIEDRLTAEDVLAATRYSCLEMLACGTTNFVDMYFFEDMVAQAAQECGIRASLSRAVQAFSPEESIGNNKRVNEGIDLYDRFNGSCNDRIHIDFGIHAEYTITPELVRDYSKECKKRNAHLHIHLSETQREHEECIEKYGKTPSQWFYDLGAFDNPTSAAHCVMVTEEDMEILKACKVNVSHNPSSNMKLGSGFAPVRRMLDKGINVGIGTDGVASNNNQNMFEELHLASIIHNGYHRDPTLLQAKDILDMGTLHGAAFAGREDIGKLETGYKADIIAVDMEKLHMYPDVDTAALLTYSAQGSDVCMTMVDGTILYENGTFLTVDEKQIRKDMEKAYKRLYNL